MAANMQNKEKNLQALKRAHDEISTGYYTICWQIKFK